MRSPAQVLGGCLIGLVVTACGGRDGAPARETSRAALPNVDVCQLLPRDEATGFLGEPVGEGIQQQNLRNEEAGTLLATCLYLSEQMNSISLLVRYRRGERPPASLDALRAEASDHTAFGDLGKEIYDASQPVDGLGVVSFWTPEMKTLTTYTAQGYLVAVTVTPVERTDAAARNLAIEVARPVLDRLP